MMKEACEKRATNILDISGKKYAFDSTTIPLYLATFPWAKFRRRKGGVKSHDTFIENVDIILVEGLSKFGNGVEVSVLNETGGREVLISDKLSAHQAYIMALYRHRPELINRMKAITDFYSSKHSSDIGTIGNHDPL